MAVGTLDTRPVSRFRAIAAGVAELIAVTALDLGHVARLRAFLRDVTLLVAVAAGHNALLLALLSTVTFLTAVTAKIGLAVRAAAREVAHLAAVLALNIIHVGRLRAFLRHVALFAAVATTSATTLLQRLLAVTSTVTNFVAVDTLLDDLVFRLTLFLLTLGPGVTNFFAVGADDDEAIHGEAGLTKAVDVFLGT